MNIQLLLTVHCGSTETISCHPSTTMTPRPFCALSGAHKNPHRKNGWKTGEGLWVVARLLFEDSVGQVYVAFLDSVYRSLCTKFRENILVVRVRRDTVKVV